MATAETVMAVYSISIRIAPDGVRGQGTGKPDEIERLMSGLERGRRKSTERQLADVLLYRTPGSEGEVPGNRHLYPTAVVGLLVGQHRGDESFVTVCVHCADRHDPLQFN